MTSASHPNPPGPGAAKEPDLTVVPGHDAEKIGESALEYGQEGSNKTIPFPKPDAQPADELQGIRGKFIPKTPYTRG